jgi:hypothetical protein
VSESPPMAPHFAPAVVSANPLLQLVSMYNTCPHVRKVGAPRKFSRVLTEGNVSLVPRYPVHPTDPSGPNDPGQNPPPVPLAARGALACNGVRTDPRLMGPKPSREAIARSAEANAFWPSGTGRWDPRAFMGPDAGAFSSPRTRFARARVPRGPLATSLRSVAAVLTQRRRRAVPPAGPLAQWARRLAPILSSSWAASHHQPVERAVPINHRLR